jgi:predicted Zn-dependent peptidase
VRAAWHICSTNDPAFATFKVIEALLFNGESSTLQQLLVEKSQVCQSVSGGTAGDQFDPSLFTMDLVVVEDGDPAKAEALVYETLEKLAKDGPGAREMQKAKNGLRADFVRRLRTINDKAFLLGETETFFGGWKGLAARAAAIDAVKAEDVKAVVAKYFTAKNRTVVTLMPTGGDEKDKDEDGKDDGKKEAK